MTTVKELVRTWMGDIVEININGDCVWGVFEKQYTSDIDSVFDISAKLNS